MRRPTSDVRQRESRRSSLDINGARRRNSSVPFPNQRLERNPNSMDSDTDFLCDRAVEFMESGDIHSIVAVELAEQSVYFERLLRYHKGRGYIRLPEFLNSGFASVLEFIRKGSTEINADNVYNIFIAADYLLVPKLKQECANLLKEIANDPSIAISLWLSCRTLCWPEVGTMAFQKILENFEQVWPTSDFQQLEPKDVWLILREDGLNCKRERNVFEAIQQWIDQAPKTRMNYALDLLLCIRIGMMTSADVEVLKSHELCKSVPEYYAILQDWPKCLVQPTNPIVTACAKMFVTPRLPHEVVMVFGGWCDGEGPRAAAQVYNPRANSWTLWTEAGPQPQSPAHEWLDAIKSNLNESSDNQATTTTTTGSQAAQDAMSMLSSIYSTFAPDGVSHDMDDKLDLSGLDNCGNLIGEIPRRVYAGCVLIGSRVYLVGGFDGTNALKSTLCYDFEIDSGWYEISCMYEKRYYVSVAYANNHIYALGGHNGENQGRLDTAERYTLQENLWQTIASMNRVRSDAAAAELAGRVYVAGGFEGRRYHDSAEYYEPETNQWTLVSRMHSPRGGISLAQLGGYLYAIGGNDGNSRLRTIERYDLNEGKWELVGQMNRRKSNLSSTVVNDEIYILGGWSDEPEAGILDLVEKFNTVTKECHVVRPLTFPASATCACTLKDRNLVKKYIRPLPVSSSTDAGPQFGEFSSKNLDESHWPNGIQSNNATSPNYDTAYATPSITGQRNTNNQISVLLNSNCSNDTTSSSSLSNVSSMVLTTTDHHDLSLRRLGDPPQTPLFNKPSRLVTRNSRNKSGRLRTEPSQSCQIFNEDYLQHSTSHESEDFSSTESLQASGRSSRHTNTTFFTTQRLRSPWRSSRRYGNKRTTGRGMR